MKKSFLLGLAATLLPWTAWAQDVTSPFVITGVTDGAKITYAGDETQPSVKVQFQNPDTEELKDLTEGTDYEISYTLNNAASTTTPAVRNVGNYTMTVTGKGIYTHNPSKEVSFTVTKKEVATFLQLKTGLSAEYNGSNVDVDLTELLDVEANTFSFLAAGDDKSAFIKCLKVDETKLGESNNAKYPNIGKYSISIKDNGDDSNNYSYATQSGMWVDFEITQKALTLTQTSTRLYDGKEVEINNLTEYKNQHFELSGVVESDDVDFSIVKEKDGKEIKDAGTYTLEVQLTGDQAANYTIGDATYEVGRVELTIKKVYPFEEISMMKPYGIKDTEEDYYGSLFIADGFVTGEDAETIKLSMKRDFEEEGESAENVGLHKIYAYNDGEKITDNETAFANYSLIYNIDADGNKLKINPKNLADLKLAIADFDKTYQGQNFVVEDKNITVTYPTKEIDENKELTVNTDYTISVSEAKDANKSFTITINAVEGSNYTGTKSSEEYTIEKATLTISAKQDDDDKSLATKVYGEEDPALYGDEGVYDIEGFKGEDTAESIGLSLIRENGEDAGFYIVRPAKDGETFWATEYNTKFENYNISYVPDAADSKFVISKKSLEYWVDNAEKVYDATANAPKGGFTLAVEESALADRDETVAGIFTTAPNIATTLEDKVVSAKNVGTYGLTVTNAESVTAKNYELTYKAESNGKYTITPATMTITAPNGELAFAASEETVEAKLKEWATYNAGCIITPEEAAFSNDRTLMRKMITITLGKNVEEANRASGEYKEGIVINIKSEDLTEAEETLLNNYGGIEEITLNHGTLTIGLVDDLELNGAVEDDEMIAKIEAHDGAKVKTVTVKNLKSLTDAGFKNDGKWYTLVLPFDVTVREVSNALGYAIVNVPNTSNNDPTKAVMKLTMGTVPANTLMAFKVDNTLNSDNDVNLANGVTFTNKTIVAPTEEYSVEKGNEDAAGTKFIAVYQPETIDGDNQYYLYPANGTFYPASARNGGMLINPMNGYIEFSPKADLSKIRIILEEADGTATEISAVGAETIKSAEGWYTVSGVKLNAEPTEKGIYINNGKKVVIK